VCCHFCELKTKLSRGFEIKKWLHHFLIWYKSALVGDALFFKIMSNLYRKPQWVVEAHSFEVRFHNFQEASSGDLSHQSSLGFMVQHNGRQL